jgi:hypothetical protein
MRSYSGGKFEVTEKGHDFYIMYDINSAYPYEISQLKSLKRTQALRNRKYRKDADYSYFDITAKVPIEVHNSHPQLIKNVNVFCVGEQNLVLTKKELEYFQSQNIDFTINNAWHIFCKSKKRIFEKEILRLYELKAYYKKIGDYINERIVKILLNSLYGKFWQLIEKEDGLHAGILFNPFYASEITANCRLTITRLQQKYNCIKAVHTDSVLSTDILPLPISDRLGEYSLDEFGQGVIIGSGVYTIAHKNKLRGFSSKVNLGEICLKNKGKVKLTKIRPRTWNEVTFHEWDPNRINLFENDEKYLRVDFDSKRIWLNDYKRFNEVFDRKVKSMPYMYNELFNSF